MNSKRIKSVLTDNRAGQIGSSIFIILSGLGVAIVGAGLVLWWRKLTKSTFKSLGLYKPESLIRTIMLGVFLGLLIKFVFVSLVMPALGSVPAANSPFSFLKGNLTNALLFSIYVIVVGGFSEELIFRGFLYRQAEGWFGSSKTSLVLMVIIGSLIFGLPHIYQGGFGVVQSILVGMIYGTMYLVNKRNLWMVMIAHAVFDLFSIYIIYNDLSTVMNSMFF
ncbi:MAG: CPBP family intramembrane metalloprotease [Roseivirga sp.]|nr:CPBP family intramembrane metalloprotease [Roseivirga sp.]